jgi:hypothetical protein
LEEFMRITSLLLIAALITTGYARAQTQPATPAQSPGWEATLKGVTEACKQEKPQLCPGLSEATALACLQSNYDKLTPSCKDAVLKAAKSALNL